MKIHATVEKNKPSARFAAMNTEANAYSSGNEPWIGTWNTTRPNVRISVIWM